MKTRFITLRNGDPARRRELSSRLAKFISEFLDEKVLTFDPRESTSSNYHETEQHFCSKKCIDPVTRGIFLCGALHEDYVQSIHQELLSSWVIAQFWHGDIHKENEFEMAFTHVYNDYTIDCNRLWVDIRDEFRTYLYALMATERCTVQS